MMLKQVLGNRSLLILGFAESVSGLGSWITALAVFSLLIFRGEGSVGESSGIFLAALLPLLLMSPVAGWLIDRFDRRRLMIASELLAGSAVAGLIFTENLILIYLLLALQSSFNAIMMPARQAVVPDIVARNQLTQANAFLQQLAGIIKVGAPIFAGALLAVVNPHTAIILDVISYGLSALILSRLPSLPAHRKETATIEEGTKSDSAEPVPSIPQLLRALPRLRILFLGLFLTTVIIVGFDVLAAIFTRDVLQGSESLFGVLIGLVGLGTVLSAAALMLAKHQRNLWRDVLTGLLLLGMLPALAALGAWLGNPLLARGLLAIGGLLGGLGGGLIHVQSGTLLQILSPASLLGRMGGLFQATAVGGQVVGILLTPLLVPGLLSVSLYFAAGSIAILLLVIYMVITMARTSDPVLAEVPVVPMPESLLAD